MLRLRTYIEAHQQGFKIGIIGVSGFLGIALVVLVATDRLGISLFGPRAAGPDAVLLYGQDLKVPAGANLNDPSTQRSILKDVRDGYSKSWDLDQLQISSNPTEPIPPERGTLYFNQIFNGARVEGGFVSMVLNEVGASDDILSDGYIVGIRKQDPQLSPDQAKAVLVPPLDATLTEPELVYHYSSASNGGVEPANSGETSLKKQSNKSLTADVDAPFVEAPSAPAPDTAPTEPAPTTEATPTESPAITPEASVLPSPEITESPPLETTGTPDALTSQSTTPAPTDESLLQKIINVILPSSKEDGAPPSPSVTLPPPTATIPPGTFYRLAYRMQVVNAITPYIPNSISGGRGRSKNMTPAVKSIENQFCDVQNDNKDCDTSLGLVCNSISQSCKPPYVMQSCLRDVDCNADGATATKYCGTNQRCHVQDSGKVGNNLATGNGLLGSYYCYDYISGANFHKFDRVDPQVNFNWGTTSPVNSYCPQNNNDYFDASWAGKLEAPATGLYTFYLNIDDYGSLKINGVDVIPFSKTRPPGEYKGTINLVAGKRYDIYTDMTEKTNNAKVVLSWSFGATPKQIIPQSFLYTYDALPPQVTIQPQDATRQEGMTVNFDAAADGTGPMPVQWNKNGIAIPGATQSRFTIPAVSLADAGAYTATYTNAFGTDTTKAATLTVNPIPGGSGTGLHGYYFSDTILTKPITDRIDPTVDFDWGTGSPFDTGCRGCAAKFTDHFGVRWYGEIYAPAAGDYSICISTDDGGRLWLDDKLVIDNWYIPDTGNLCSGLHAGVPGRHTVRYEYWEGTDTAQAHLSWYGPNMPFNIIPQTYLFPLDFTLPTPNTEVGDMVWVDAITGKIIDKVSTLKD